ncbi:MAG: hypothetical protein K2J60_08165 [Acetatifactor sp.]|nr:hypothetical protein [Acetatifactor sp.]
MNTFGILLKYEYKKLLQKKITRISLIFCIIATIFSCISDLLGDYYIDGERVDSSYHMAQIDQSYARTLNGREIDRTLLAETVEAYRKIPKTTGHYTGTAEYQQYARPYSEILTFIHMTTLLPISEIMYQWQADEQDLYARQLKQLGNDLDALFLSEGEKAFWLEKNAQIKKPFVYQAHAAYHKQFSIYQTTGLIVLTLIAVCLAGVFSDEHSRRTDQLILCSAKGKSSLYWAKMLAGAGFAAGISVLFSFLSVVLTMFLYGTEGFTAPFQLVYCFFVPMSCGQVILIAYGIMLITSVIFAVFIMFLSELTHSSIASLAIGIVLLLVTGMISIPGYYRVPAQIWQWLPFSFLAIWNIFNYYTLPLFGHYFTAWQAVPVIYLVAGLGIAAAGKPIYRKYQVTGR